MKQALTTKIEDNDMPVIARAIKILKMDSLLKADKIYPDIILDSVDLFGLDETADQYDKYFTSLYDVIGQSICSYFDNYEIASEFCRNLTRAISKFSWRSIPSMLTEHGVCHVDTLPCVIDIIINNNKCPVVRKLNLLNNLIVFAFDFAGTPMMDDGIMFWANHQRQLRKAIARAMLLWIVNLVMDNLDMKFMGFITSKARQSINRNYHHLMMIAQRKKTTRHI